jgi:hypothetical protein
MTKLVRLQLCLRRTIDIINPSFSNEKMCRTLLGDRGTTAVSHEDSMQHVLNVKYTADGPSIWRTTIGRSPRFAYVRGEVSHKIRSGGVDSPPF